MKVEKLVLRHFRNISESEFRPSPHLNFLVGPNGQGKTSYLEALSFLGTLRSFRGSKPHEVIQWKQSHAEVRATLSSESGDAGDAWTAELKTIFDLPDPLQPKASKIAFINGKPYRSSTQYLSQRFGSFQFGFHTVIFNPSDHDLIRGEPALRRSYLDKVLAAENIEYLRALQKYQRILEHRNAVLKDYWQKQNQGKELLFGFTQSLAQSAVYLTLERLKWIYKAAEHLNNTAQQIAPGQPFLKLIYHSNWAPETAGLCSTNNNLTFRDFAGHQPLPSLELLEQGFWNQVSLLESAEWRVGHSLVGPHRDDWAFYFGDQPLKGHGSQGEVRSALLALKLSEIELFRNQTGHRPLFLLDDFSSELDRERRSFLLRFLSDTDLQVFVTTTEESLFLGKRHWVINGSLREDEHSGQSEQSPRVSE